MWLEGTFAQPELSVDATKHYLWKSNDKSLRAFMLNTISRNECKAVCHLTTAKEVWDALRMRHEKRGPFAQLILVKQGIDVRFSMAIPFSDTINKIDDLITRIENMGDFDWQKFKTVLLINALGGELEYLQSHIYGMADDPGFSSASVVHRIHREQDLIKHRAVQGEGPSALITQNRRHERTICSHCHKPGHHADFCIAPGGKFVGHTLDEARAAQRAAWAKERAQNSGLTRSMTPGNAVRSNTTNATTNTANIATTDTQTNAPDTSVPTPPTQSNQSMTINGIMWVPMAQTIDSVQIALGPTIEDDFEFATFHAEHKGDVIHHASVDWSEFSHPIETNTTSAYTSPANTMPNNSPFILDSGASCHISPSRGDFKTLTMTSPHPIRGLGESCVYAVGTGTVELCTNAGKTITLNNALFVPNAAIRLISVYTVNNDGQNSCHFDATTCTVTGPDGTTLLTGTAWKQRRLYTINRTIKPITHAANPMDVALYAARTPDVETWHRCLGHCDHRTVIDMARQNVAKGMPIDLSSAPATCDHCVLGKQTRSHIPRAREGKRAAKRLERVFVDLCGPMPVVSKYNNLYSMNVIDDYSSYVWSIPLSRKSDAVNALQTWHRAVENQTNDKLKIIVTDNGELASQRMTTWCKLHGIEHRLTAPYTSAQNGRAERLHRTILGKARAMRLSCNAPAELWDEFCATSAYLTNFTASSSNEGKTPYELWFGDRPSLSHLREIGCRAFALIQTNNPKIFQRSTPCILIGYAPRSKAYRLWDITTGRVFNSFHVTFVEHLQAQPTKLLPGTTIQIDPDAPATWASLPNAPPAPAHTPPTNDPANDPVPPLLPPIIIRPPPPQPAPQLPPAPPAPPPPPQLPPPPPPPTRLPTIIIPPQRPQRRTNTINVDRNNNNTNVPVDSSDTNNNNTAPVHSNNNNNAIDNNNAEQQLDNINNTIPVDSNNNNNANINNNETPPHNQPPLRRSARLVQRITTDQLQTALLSEYAPLADSHDLIPIYFTPSDFESLNVFLSSLSDGSTEPLLDTGDDPSWATAIRSPEREYWIAGA